MLTNAEAIQTSTVLLPLNNERGMSLKFEYGIVKILGRLEGPVDKINAMQDKLLEGQEEYIKARDKLLRASATKDENGKPITQQIGTRISYDIADMPAHEKKMKKLDEKHPDYIKLREVRDEEVKEFLAAEVDDFEPWEIKAECLPVDKEGNCRLTIIQLKYLMPFITGDIDKLD